MKTLLDTRRQKSDGCFNIIFRITHERKVYTLNSGISAAEFHWNKQKSEIDKTHPNSKLLNIKLSNQFFKIQKVILELDIDFTISELRNRVEGKPESCKEVTFKSFSDNLIYQMLEITKTGNALVYQTALNRFVDFYGKDDFVFTDINYSVLKQFEHHLLLAGLKLNSISNYIRTIRAIYNKAIKLKVVDRSFYPFYDISIKSEKTTKRAVLKEDLYKILLCKETGHTITSKSLNLFFLSFYLRGISFTDLAYLTPLNIIDGRLTYKRRKTHKNYSIKLFPEALSIIFQFNVVGSKYLLPILPNDVPEDTIRAKKIISQCIKTTNKYLKRLSIANDFCTPITTYTSRHSFATIAKRLGYSNELIAEALGHEYGNKITNIYLDAFETKVIDEMHFKVMDMKEYIKV
ncbi:site-specific integrase [Flavobacterium sp. WC2421]|uniref:phage integrase SAM-like domain-containing protein n=1 Tax=Flavobacterium sp. WC2421 TaxID=3234138 RepID=UPI003466C871